MRLRRLSLLPVVLLLASAYVLMPLPAAHGQSTTTLMPTTLAEAVKSSSPPQGYSPPRSAIPSPPGDPIYDEQLGLTFTENFYSIQYNVTAVAQSDPTSGVGPGYLLQGLSDKGYWYQVSLLYNWPYTNGGYNPGFYMGYEVFDPNGTSIFPEVCCTGLLSLSGPVHSGDSVTLNLYFGHRYGLSNLVYMIVDDQSTGAQATVSYSDEGATYFAGLPFSTADKNGFFTGLMTEWYRPSPYYGDELKVVYSSSIPLSSAWMWIDEYSPPCCSSLLFYSSTPGAVSYAANPAVLHEFSSNGAKEYSSAYNFITGSIPLVSVSMSYNIQGGGSRFSPPVLYYYQYGVPLTASLGTTPTPYLMDEGSRWNVSATLTGSNADERWATPQMTSGAVNASQTVEIIYYHQFDTTVSYQVIGGGAYSPPQIVGTYFGKQIDAELNESLTTYWFDAGTPVSLPQQLPVQIPTERWTGAGYNAVLSGAAAISAVYFHQFYATIQTAQQEGGSLTSSGWYNATSSLQLQAKANPGWRFEGWQGTGPASYTGSSNSTTITMASAVVENATFFPELTVTDGVFGQVSYMWGSTSVTITAGHGGTFVPAGTKVSFDASPSIFAVFTGYRGGLNSTNPNASIVVNGPIHVEATFAPNLFAIGAVAAAVVAGGAGITYAIRVRAGRRQA